MDPKKMSPFVTYAFLLLLMLVTKHVIGQSSGIYPLKDGVIVNPANNMAYLMSPGGGIEAINLTDGKVEWQTKNADKPLAVIGKYLIGQSEKQTARGNLIIVTLDIANKGSLLSSKSITLPENVNTSINDILNSSFKSSAAIRDSLVFLSWDFKSLPKRRIGDETVQREDVDNRSVTVSAAREEKGLIRLNLQLDQIDNLDPSVPPIETKPKFIELKSSDKKPDIPGRQFYSIDNKSIVGVERISDDSKWLKYKWTIYNDSGEKLGSINSHFSYTPFYVSGTQLIFISNPYIRKENDHIIDEPLKLKAVSLETGEELWSVDVRDTEYRGPFPS